MTTGISPLKDFHHSCQGESHIRTGKICQDASFSETSTAMSIAIVCDGHGGARYFRSDVGAQIAVETVKTCVTAFVKEVDVNAFKGTAFRAKGTIASEAQAKVLTKETKTDKVLRQLFASIIYRWRKQIDEHAAQTPLSEEEMQKVEQRHRDEFNGGIGVEKTYGCTLMCYVATPDYWFAFHLGDGKCVAFDTDGIWHEPIPWDERCFLNQTTSLCDFNALNEFRYCYCGDGNYPMAVFLGSDGIDDTFGPMENLANFYIQVLKHVVKEGHEKAEASLKESLPQLSKIGSKDDMSVACIYNKESLASHIERLIAWQQENVGASINYLNEHILKFKATIAQLQEEESPTEKTEIDLRYAKKDLEDTYKEKRSLVQKWNVFAKELHGEDYTPYTDSIGPGEDTTDEAEKTDGKPTDNEEL